jgi:membrane-bound ClpP family serine protease
MVGFLQFLGILSVLGGMLGVFEFGYIDYGSGIMEANPYLIGVYIASALVGFGLFWALAAIIDNLKKINEKLKKEGD